MEARPVEQSTRPIVASRTSTEFDGRTTRNESIPSSVSWAPVIAGAFVIAALGLILISLGAGLGLASVSPWSSEGLSATAVGIGTIVWLTLVQVLSSGMGGYLTGRLRTKWTYYHGDEVYFRDTAHGFLAWTLALVVSAGYLATAATYMTGQTASSTAIGAAASQGGNTGDPNDYFIDMMFRNEKVNPNADPASVSAEAARIFAKALAQGELVATDKRYLGRLVAARTDLSQSEAEARVDETFSSAQQAVDTAREATSYLLLWGFIALLLGAFCASYGAMIGGRQRDRLVAD